MSIRRVLVVLLLLLTAAGAAVTFFGGRAVSVQVRGTAYRLSAPPSAGVPALPPSPPDAKLTATGSSEYGSAGSSSTDAGSTAAPRLLGWPTEQPTQLGATASRRIWELLDSPDSYRISTAGSGSSPTLGIRLEHGQRTVSALLNLHSGRVLIVDGEDPDDELPDVRHLSPAALAELTELLGPLAGTK